MSDQGTGHGGDWANAIGHFHIPGDAARRDYAVYIIVAKHRLTKDYSVYVGKTGDNFDGCNPIISRAGNHLSFNKLHAQTRNRLGSPEDYDFDVFYTTFGGYVPKSECRDGLDLINCMERQLNHMAQDAFPDRVANPISRAARRTRKQIETRSLLATEERQWRLVALVKRVRDFVAG